MRPFEHKVAAFFEETSRLLKSGDAAILAGGTDILNAQEQAILEEHPAVMVDLKKIPGGAGIEEKDDSITVGALTTPLLLTAALNIALVAMGALCSPMLRKRFPNVFKKK